MPPKKSIKKKNNQAKGIEQWSENRLRESKHEKESDRERERERDRARERDNEGKFKKMKGKYRKGYRSIGKRTG